MELRRPKNCPNCGSSKFREIRYGRATAETLDAVDRGEIVLGGCLIMPDQPDWECASCEYRWFDAEDPERIKRDKFYNDLINKDLDSHKDT
jgi:hypothetical protein